MNIAVIGGGERHRCLGKTLEDYGHTVIYIADPARGVPQTIHALQTGREAQATRVLQSAGEVQVAVLPVPTGSECEALTGVLPDGCVVFGWNVPEKIMSAYKTYDFGKMEHVAALNAVATAEGCIAEMITHGKINITGSKCLITGYGRCAKEIASKLQAFGACVTIAARDRAAREHAACHGMDVCNMFERDSYREYDYVINTVPAMVIGRREAEKMNDDVVIIDIASMPGGTDLVYCREHGIKVVHTLGLPGKYSPKTSGRILANAIIDLTDNITDE